VLIAAPQRQITVGVRGKDPGVFRYRTDTDATIENKAAAPEDMWAAFADARATAHGDLQAVEKTLAVSRR
jgi:hypothetical protein